MTELFGGFPSAFYQGYQEVFPLNQGYEYRKTLYNLYHILNHFNLFIEYTTPPIPNKITPPVINPLTKER